MNKLLFEPMKAVRKLVSMSERLRKNNGLNLSQELLDIAYYSPVYLNKNFRRLLGEAVGMCDLGYDMGDRLCYTLDNDWKPPKDWLVETEGDYWIALDPEIPDWLKKRNEQKREHRKEIMKRKKNDL